jgi:hypothetical protein
MAHAVNNSVDALDEVVDEQIISQGSWSLWPPDLNQCLICGTCQQEKWMWKICIPMEELQENIMHEISAIPIQQLQYV